MSEAGADVTLIAGPVALTCSPDIHRINVESCEEMYNAATSVFPDTDIAILCAAVADFKPQDVATQKIKRHGENITLTLCPTHDIASAVGQMKRKNQVIVAFALETNDEEENAKKKLEKKNADFIVMNSLRNSGTCFRTDDNQISIIGASDTKTFPKKPKVEVAKDIIDHLCTHL